MPRYAIYFVPPAETEFFRFGSAVLGYDCYTGASVGRPAALDAEPEFWDRLTAEPRRYGFHATLKAPFTLSPSMHGSAARQRAPQLCRARPFNSGVDARGSNAQRLCRDRAGGGFAGDRRTGRQMHHDLRCVSGAHGGAGACAAGGVGIEPEPDREPRPLGLSLPVRRFQISHDADQPGRPGTARRRAGRRCRKRSAGRAKTAHSRSSGFRWYVRTMRIRRSA